MSEDPQKAGPLGPAAKQVEQYIDYCLSMVVDSEDHKAALDAVSTAVVPEVMELERRLRHALDPDNWRVVFTGDPTTQDLETTSLTHGNYITVEGTGQVLLHYTPPEEE